MSYSRELVRKLKGEERKENPLEMIRLSPDILMLGLSNDDLYDYCRRSARFLLAKVHPDHFGRDAETSEIAKRYSEAFNLLEDRGIFERAIAEFREMHSYQRREERTLAIQIQNSQGKVRELEESLRKAQEDIAKRRHFHEWTRGYLIGRATRFSEGDAIKSVIERTELTVVTFAFTFSPHAPQREGLLKIREEYAQVLRKLPRKRKSRWSEEELEISDELITGLQSTVNAFHLEVESVSVLIERARKSGYKAPAIRWSYELAMHELEMPKIAHLLRKDYGGVIEETYTAKWTHDELQRYWIILRELSRVFGDRCVTDMIIAPQKLFISDQTIVGDAVNESQRLHVLGSIDLYKGLFHRKDSPHNKLYRVEIPENILHEVEPFLYPGRAIVSFEEPKLPRMPKKEINGAKILGNLMQKNHPIFMSHIVLNVT
ncbi:MAG: hypothetical protein G01um101433_424 [Parcubacteria group bacterium Gr01-1014_33]|nr:MAG: hypothetical protein G01um101433_424 [Parcubacteria group bacterium Gr01-1014_33]